MGFNKRFLSEDTIKSYAKSHTFHEFEKMMINSDSYTYLDSYSAQIGAEFFISDKETKNKIYNQITQCISN